MNQEESVKIFDLAVKSNQLPASLGKLVPLSFIGSAAVKFYQAKVKLMDQLGMSEAQRKATLADGQDAGEMLLNIEARIGELISSTPRRYDTSNVGDKKAPKQLPSLPDGVTSRRSTQSQAIHRNPAAVAAVIKEARENEDIPTKTAVLKQIQLDRAKELQKDRIPENERIRTLLGEEEFAEWTTWMRIRMKVKERLHLSKMSSAARKEIQKVIDGIVSDIGAVCDDRLKITGRAQ